MPGQIVKQLAPLTFLIEVQGRGGCRIFGKGGLLNAKGWYSMVAIRPPSLGGSGGTPPQEILRFEVL